MSDTRTGFGFNYNNGCQHLFVLEFDTVGYDPQKLIAIGMMFYSHPEMSEEVILCPICERFVTESSDAKRKLKLFIDNFELWKCDMFKQGGALN